MSRAKEPKKVKLVISLFSGSNVLLDKAVQKLVSKYGDTDYTGNDIRFEETDYYRDEMGENLLFRVISFKKPVKRNSLPDVKIFCWKLEERFSVSSGANRQVNIDPGLLSLENFILATGKGFAHRIYLGKGVYADLTLIYKKEGFMDLPWTYLNYKDKKIKDIIRSIRDIYFRQLKS